ncbi:MAG TPA: hypothetical protein P5526_21320, partial [Anaerolineae bacterium]|nr:hypothetical protein [Anaerolineae bacterium]
RKMVPTAKKSFLPTAERSVPSPNSSYRRRMACTDRRTIRTTAERLVRTAERFVPPPNGLYRPPNDSYHRRMACTDRRMVRTAEENGYWLSYLSVKYRR